MNAGIRITLASLTTVAFSLLHGSMAYAQQNPAASGISTQDSENELTVSVGKTVLVDTTHPIQRVAVGLGDFAEASAVTPNEIMINGKAPGETSLIIWEAGGERQFFNVSVRSAALIGSTKLEGLRREMKLALPGQDIKISVENDTVFLRGTAKDLASSERAVEMASSLGKVVNLLYVNIPNSDPQILLKVRFASVDRTMERQLGINFFSNGFGNVLGGITTGQFSPPSTTLPSGTNSATTTISNELNLFAFLPGLNVGATLEALETKGVVEVLAEPNVMTTNGKQASFLAGGEYPYPVVQGTASGGAGAVTLEFKEYGVRLNFLPIITPRGTIRLQVAPEVSSLDFSNAIQISGFDIPAIDTRKMNTEIELSDGQSFAISGLLDNRETQTFQKVPFLGDVPILGKLFQSIQKTKSNTELLVIVTAEVVAPLQAGAELPKLHYPESFMPPNSNIPMNHPDAKTAANTMAPALKSMPVEELKDSLKPEPAMRIESGGISFGAGSAQAGTGAQTTQTPAPVTTTAPQ
ncbi:type II and III secretion system protein family protein [Acidicapsa dinghuensis]|uniref:Type II and III secretion system protein family protein n=1 Tax=Acidicapsa dinghuensis TaxID=2218256 RepID=A0ABW1EHM5_9BACT|nr:pilus assembly protein N-terminal domain-containing protein [Acidicapsa dinghuensis]